MGLQLDLQSTSFRKLSIVSPLRQMSEATGLRWKDKKLTKLWAYKNWTCFKIPVLGQEARLKTKIVSKDFSSGKLPIAA